MLSKGRITNILTTALLVFGSGCFVLSPEMAHAQLQDRERGKALLESGEWSDALVLLKSDFNQRPELDTAFLIARALVGLKRREEALQFLAALNTSKRTSSEREMIRERIRVLSRLFYTQESVQKYHQALRKVESAEWQDAADVLTELLNNESGNVEVMVRLAQVEIELQRYSMALEKLESAQAINPFEPMIRLWIARARTFIPEQSSEGLSDLEKVIRIPEFRSLATQALLWWLEVRMGRQAEFSAPPILARASALKKISFSQSRLGTPSPLDQVLQTYLEVQYWLAEGRTLTSKRPDWVRQGQKLAKTITSLIQLNTSSGASKPVVLGEDLALTLLPDLGGARSLIADHLAPFLIPYRPGALPRQ